MELRIAKEYAISAFSYLAAARILRIDTYPAPNDGAGIRAVIDTLVADGPLAVAILAKLGVATYLLTNSVGNDADGKNVIERLDQTGLEHMMRY